MSRTRSINWAKPTVLGCAIWLVTWILLWISQSDSSGAWSWINQPALVALQLGLLGLLTFVGIYVSETEGQLRAAIAATVVIVFILLVIDLLTIVEFRLALTEVGDVPLEGGADASDPASDASASASAEVATSFVEGLFGTFKWVVTSIVAFYFAAGAAQEITDKVQSAKTERVHEQLEIAKLEAKNARGGPAESKA